MTDETRDKLIRNTALLVCSLADSKAGRIQADIDNMLIDGKDSCRAEGWEHRQQNLDRFNELIAETRITARRAP